MEWLKAYLSLLNNFLNKGIDKKIPVNISEIIEYVSELSCVLCWNTQRRLLLKVRTFNVV